MAEKRMFAKNKRQKEMLESDLPYSFTYKIRKAFNGKPCPICGFIMATHIEKDLGIVTNNHIPTIQHNVPISKGGKHKLGNISVICKKCNITIKDNDTPELNAKEVTRLWQTLNG